MNLILAIETSTMTGSVALGQDGRVLGEVVIPQEQKQNEALLPAIDQLLTDQRAERRAISAIVIGGGPGSFTGLRIAAATAKGMVHALRIPFYAYSGLLAAAFDVSDQQPKVCALFDARRDEVYSATYHLIDDLESVRAPQAESIMECLAANDVASTTFCGDGAVKHRSLITGRGGAVAEPQHVVPRASALLHLQARWPEYGFVATPADWEPDYLRASGAERGING